jgi:hypothetical protein
LEDLEGLIATVDGGDLRKEVAKSLLPYVKHWYRLLG